MNSPLLILAYANHDKNPLPNLAIEKSAVEAIVNKRKKVEDFEILQPSTRTDIRDILTDPIKSKSLILFSYSGHADADKLITEDEITNAHGLVKLLGACNNLKLVILNGCSTEKQVRLLFEAFKESKRTSPVIVATSAKVSDKLAAEFAIVFFEQICLFNRTVGRAFETAINAVKTQEMAQTILADKREGRGLGIDADDKPIWGIYTYLNDQKEALNWTLGQSVNDPQIRTYQYEPNKKLLHEIIKALKDYVPEIKTKLEKERFITSINSYKAHIYQSFPYPISKRLHELIATRSPNDKPEVVFYDLPDQNRLGQLIRTAQTLIEILCVIAQAEWWNFFESDAFSPSTQSQELYQVFKENKVFQYQRTSFLSKLVTDICRKNTPFFFKEFKERMTYFQPDGAIYELGNYFEIINKNFESLSQTEVKGVLPIAENHLADLFTHCIFFANYQLTSVNNIALINNRSIKPANYTHKIFHQQYHLEGTPQLDDLKELYYLENASVLLHRGKQISNEYLNLSPFLLDDSIFLEKASNSNLISIQASKPDTEILIYSSLLTSNSAEKKELTFKVDDDGVMVYHNLAFFAVQDQWRLFLETLSNKHKP